MKGVEPQTVESIELLKSRRVPFLVAANKIDLIDGWIPSPGSMFMESIKKQDPHVVAEFEVKISSIISELASYGFNANRFDRIRDFRREIAVVPVSAKTGEGIPELLAVLVGITQQYMRSRLMVASGAAKGSILEVLEEPGLGHTANVIIYDGILRKGDLIVTMGRSAPISTRVRALFQPKPLQEIRMPTGGFEQVEEVAAAAGVKIVAPNLEDAIPGAPLYVVEQGRSINEYVQLIMEEVRELLIKTDRIGVVVKADTLGSLEALISELKRNSVPVRIADIGPVTRRDVIEAEASRASDPLYGVILAFNVKILPEAEEEAMGLVPIFANNIIYRLIEDYLSWASSEKDRLSKLTLKDLVMPGKVKVLQGYVFRRSKPAIVGVEVLAGRIRAGSPLMRSDGKLIGRIEQIQDRGKPIPEATAGMKIAISIDKPTVGRHFDEGDILYVYLSERDELLLYEKLGENLRAEDKELIVEIARIRRGKV
jgi:translation initiation factor 5B